jgi:hypothetical protein
MQTHQLRAYNYSVRRLIAVATLVALTALPLWAQGRRMGSVVVPWAPAFNSRSPGFIPRAPIVRHGSFGTSFNGFSGFRRHPRIFVRFGGRVCDPVFFDCRFFSHRRFFFSQPVFFPLPVYPEYPNQPVYAQPEPQMRDDTRERELETQIANLSEEVASLRMEEQSRYPVRPQERQPEPKHEEQKPTVLVFHDKHILEVRNYAIVGQTLWVLSQRKAKKISVSDLDLAATARLNEERGVQFQAPTGKSK